MDHLSIVFRQKSDAMTYKYFPNVIQSYESFPRINRLSKYCTTSENKTHILQLLYNGDSVKQLLARSRYILYKSRKKWTDSRNERTQIVLLLYPDIKTAYSLTQQLRSIYNNNNNKQIAMTKLAHWYRKEEESGFKNFNIILNTITFNYQSIFNYFNNRSTNASEESFNATIKAFRNQFKGVRSIDLFLFRLSNLFA